MQSRRELEGKSWIYIRQTFRWMTDSIKNLCFRHARPESWNQISACLIKCDESKNLGECRDSLKGSVDEIVVFDTGSKDDKGEIAQKVLSMRGCF